MSCELLNQKDGIVRKGENRASFYVNDCANGFSIVMLTYNNGERKTARLVKK